MDKLGRSTARILSLSTDLSKISLPAETEVDSFFGSDSDNDGDKSGSTVAFPSHSKKSRTHRRRASTVASELGNHIGNRQRKR